MKLAAGRIIAVASNTWCEMVRQSILLVGLMLIQGLLSPTVYAQSDVLSKAKEMYDRSQYVSVIDMLVSLAGPNSPLVGSDLLYARELLARTYVKAGRQDLARQMFQNILRDSPGWRPDSVVVPPDELAVFAKALAEYSPDVAAMLRNAKEHYDESRFDEAIKLLSDYSLNPLLTNTERIAASELLARCYVKAGEEHMAVIAFRTVLTLDREWKPEARLSPEELAAFQRAKALVPKKPSVWGPAIGAGVGIALGIAAVAEKVSGDAKHDEAVSAGNEGDPSLGALNDEADSHYNKATLLGIVAGAVALVDLYLWHKFFKQGGRLGPIGALRLENASAVDAHDSTKCLVLSFRY
jgi:tetratricopeptide (TPR) repeat protein